MRQAFGIMAPSEPHLSPDGWRALLALAREHAVSGWLYLALTGLPEAQTIPVDVLDGIMKDGLKIMRRSVKLDQILKEILDGVSGCSPLVMKGPSVAVYYPRPELRTSGDLDLYVKKEELGALLTGLEQLGYKKSPSPDGAWLCERDGVYVDVHLSYFDLLLPSDKFPPVPSPEAEICMLSLHILKHAMGPGVGLRQVCDLAMALRKSGYDAALVKGYFRRNGLLAWNRMLCSFISDRLGIDGPMDGEKVGYDAFESLVFSGGDMGRYGKGRAAADASGRLGRKADTAGRFLRRMPFALRYAPLRYCAYIASLMKGNATGKGGV